MGKARKKKEEAEGEGLLVDVNERKKRGINKTIESKQSAKLFHPVFEIGGLKHAFARRFVEPAHFFVVAVPAATHPVLGMGKEAEE